MTMIYHNPCYNEMCYNRDCSVYFARIFLIIHGTVLPTKSDSDVILCLQLLSKTLTCTLHLSKHESIDHLCINPILWIGLIHK